MALLSKTSTQLLQECLAKIQTFTSVTNITPGSVARAIAEIITTELSDFYSILDFNTAQNLIQTAAGTNLDNFGVLYNLRRQTLTDAASIAAGLGVFNFYIDSPWPTAIIIPSGTNIFTDLNTFVGQQFSYQTVGDSIILPGHTKVWATIRPNFTAGYFSAGANTLTILDPNFTQPVGVTVKCTNPIAIPTQVTEESDDSFRARIIASVNTVAGGTMGALRFAALTVAGVRDIVLRDTPYGMGTVEALVVTEDNLTNNLFVISSVANVLIPIKPAGVRLFINQPDILPVDVTVNIITAPTVVNVNISSAMQLTANAITNFLNAPTAGSPLVYYELIQAILNATDYTSDVIVQNLAVNGTQILRQNYTPATNEQLVPGQIIVSVSTALNP